MQIPCNHCRRDGCRLCHLYATDDRYRRLWSEPTSARPTRPARDPNKPRVNIADLAQQRRH